MRAGGATSGTRIVITPPSRFRLPAVKHMWDAREVFLRFGTRDITLRYRQTAMGVAWVVLQPLLTAGVFTLVFGKLAKLPTGGVPYFLFSFAGMLAWSAFSSTVARSAPSLVANAGLVSKVFFPRILVPLSAAYSVLVDYGVGFTILVLLLFVYKVHVTVAIVLTPVWLLLMILLAQGFGVVCAALMVRYRDVQYVVPFVLQTLLYASPVAYAMSAVPARYRLIYDLNPLSWALQEFRWSLLGQPMPPGWQLAGSLLVSLLVFFGGMLVFEQMERGFADVI